MYILGGLQMSKIFNYEKDLVEVFEKTYFNKKSTILINEMPIRWGNIDIVSITNTVLPFNEVQLSILSNPTNAKLFLKTKNNRPITEKSLIKNIGASESTCKIALRNLLKNNLIVKKEHLYYRAIDFTFPKVTISGYEAKLTDYNKAFFQSCLNKNYVDLSYMVFPIDVANRIFDQHRNILFNSGIGLIGTSLNKSITLLKAQKQNSIKDYLRLINLAQSQISVLKNEVALS